ncbi:MAG: PepSY-associated TM helix domain-containing protein [Chakrabartia sp.]
MRRAGSGLRQKVRLVHLWLGLGLGGLLVLLGLTGSALAFYPEIDALLHPEIRRESALPPDWDRALATVRATYPDKKGPWRFEVTGKPGAIPARYYDPPERAGDTFRPMMVWLSADGGQVLRRDYWGEYAMTFLYDLHYRLLLGDMGGTLLGWAGFALLALLLSGLWAWWPRGAWAKALRLKRHGPPQRTLRDWHKITGLSGLVFLLLLTATGIMLELPGPSDTALNALGLAVNPPPHVHDQNSGSLNALVLPPSQAIRAAKAALPLARVAWIETPASTGGTYRVRLQVPGDPSHRFPHSFVWVDGTTGRVVAVHDVRGSGAGSAINAWVHPLHDGSAAGLVGRSLVALVGLFPLVLFVTGWLRWRVMRQARRRPELSMLI